MGIKRLDLKVGFACNNNCRFCVVADKRRLGNLSTVQLKENIVSGARSGANEIVFTGGEVTLRKDLLELIRFARDKGFTHLQLQSNCRMLFYKDFIDKLLDAGINEFSPSIHGSTPEVHDDLVRAPGAYKQTLGAIRNLVDMDLRVLTNTVITRQNYKQLPEIAQILIDIGVMQYQFAFVHAEGNAYEYFDEIVPRKSVIQSYVHKGVDLGAESGTSVMVEAYPFCFMVGREQFCSELFIPETEVREADRVLENFSEVRRNVAKLKGPDCPRCRYYPICEGPWKEYPEKFGWEEFVPVPGQPVADRLELLH